MCWMNGGIREGGCSGPSWLVTCCVPQVTRNSEDETIIQSDHRGPPLTAGLRSAPGGAPFILANTLGESIANLQGRDDCKLTKTISLLLLVYNQIIARNYGWRCMMLLCMMPCALREFFSISFVNFPWQRKTRERGAGLGSRWLLAWMTKEGRNTFSHELLTVIFSEGSWAPFYFGWGG